MVKQSEDGFVVVQEMYVQREEYATEVGRLQKTFRKLRIMNKKLVDDNSDVAGLKQDLSTLTAKNIKLEASVTVRAFCIDICALI